MQGSCSRKFLSSGDQVLDTNEFTMYLQMLISEQVIRAKELDIWLLDLKNNKLNNPIKNTYLSQAHAFHHEQFRVLLNAGLIDIGLVQKWANEFLEISRGTETQKETTKQKTEEVPFYISHSGHRFYKINHPELGEAYRILKPNGIYEKKEDWEKVIWAVNPLRDDQGNVIEEFSNNRGNDSKDKRLVSKKSAARKACLSLGKNVDLPTVEEFAQLIEYFEFEKFEATEQFSRLTKNGLEQFHSLFPHTRNCFWTSSVFQKTSILGVLYGGYSWVFSSTSGDLSYTERAILAKGKVRCVKRED